MHVFLTVEKLWRLMTVLFIATLHSLQSFCGVFHSYVCCNVGFSTGGQPKSALCRVRNFYSTVCVCVSLRNVKNSCVIS
jgi:hypothetical protein